MGAAGQSRYVALIKDASEKAKTTFDWLNSEVGYKTFLEELSEETMLNAVMFGFDSLLLWKDPS